MQKATDWMDLWRELAELQAAAWRGPHAAQEGEDAWRDRARNYDANVRRRWATPDSSRDFVVAQLEAHPEWTALDIGGGTGAWAALMAQAAMRVWGQPYDSPDFQVAYNALLQMGIFPNVLMENSGLWDPWANSSLDEAFAEIKRKLNVPDPSEHDAFLWDLVKRSLTYVDGKYLWPRGVRSALVYWPIKGER